MLPFKKFRGSVPNPAGGLNAPPPPQPPTFKAPPFTAGYAPVVGVGGTSECAFFDVWVFNPRTHLNEARRSTDLVSRRHKSALVTF